MGRILFAIVLGLVAALAISGFADWLVSSIYPAASGDDLLNGFSLGGHSGPLAEGAKAILVAGWCFGTLVGGAIAARLGHREVDAYVVAAVVVSAAMAQSYGLVHPGWLAAAGALLPWGCAWMVGRLAHHRSPRP
jgi:hypothetical protein